MMANTTDVVVQARKGTDALAGLYATVALSRTCPFSPSMDASMRLSTTLVKTHYSPRPAPLTPFPASAFADVVLPQSAGGVIMDAVARLVVPGTPSRELPLSTSGLSAPWYSELVRMFPSDREGLSRVFVVLKPLAIALEEWWWCYRSTKDSGDAHPIVHDEQHEKRCAALAQTVRQQLDNACRLLPVSTGKERTCGEMWAACGIEDPLLRAALEASAWPYVLGDGASLLSWVVSVAVLNNAGAALPKWLFATGGTPHDTLRATWEALACAIESDAKSTYGTAVIGPISPTATVKVVDDKDRVCGVALSDGTLLPCSFYVRGEPAELGFKEVTRRHTCAILRGMLKPPVSGAVTTFRPYTEYVILGEKGKCFPRSPLPSFADGIANTAMSVVFSPAGDSFYFTATMMFADSKPFVKEAADLISAKLRDRLTAAFALGSGYSFATAGLDSELRVFTVYANSYKTSPLNFCNDLLTPAPAQGIQGLYSGDPLRFIVGSSPATAMRFADVVAQQVLSSWKEIFPLYESMDDLRLQRILDVRSMSQTPTETPPSQILAVTGISCRFPGCNSVSEFWDVLMTGKCTIKPVAHSRWDRDFYTSSVAAEPGKMICDRAGLVDDNEMFGFDHELFRINAREAQLMDPQQRALLKVSYEALEDAGIPVGLGSGEEGGAGMNIGVFVGASTTDFTILQNIDPHPLSVYSSTGSATSILANRISYVMNLRGPSHTADSACSSTMVAFDKGCQAIKMGDCHSCLVCGINVLLNPCTSVGFTKLGILGPDGLCRAFDSNTGGFVRAEGAGSLVLTTLKRAEEQGDRIYAVVYGSGTNSDGHSKVGLTMPGVKSQAALLRRVYAASGVNPREIEVIEAHGTGTAAGDPTEVEALGTVFRCGRTASKPLVVTSVKGNLGHLESASGMPGLLKAVLSCYYSVIPKSLHIDTPNPHIAWEQLRVTPAREQMPWNSAKRMIGVNSFGFGGTNSHAIIGNYIPSSTHASSSPNFSPSGKRQELLLLSARTQESVKAYAAKLARYLRANPKLPLSDVSFTTTCRRTKFSYSLACIVSSVKNAITTLEDPNTWQPAVTKKEFTAPSDIAFVFSGQGTQWHAMARDLITQGGLLGPPAEPAWKEAIIFCKVLKKIDRLLKHEHSTYLATLSQEERDKLPPEELETPDLVTNFTNDKDQNAISECVRSQHSVFALQVATARMLIACGIKPACTMGHSSGELAALHIGGHFALEDSVPLLYHRTRLLNRSSRLGGKMIAVATTLSKGLEMIKSWPNLCISAWTSPNQITISGDADQVQKLNQELKKAGVRNTILNAAAAYHSPHLEMLKADAFKFINRSSDLLKKKGTARFFSTAMCAEPASSADETMIFSDYSSRIDATYWWTAMREQVNFYPGFRNLVKHSKCRVFIEISPSPALISPMREALDTINLPDKTLVLPSLNRRKTDRQAILELMFMLQASGACPDLKWSTVLSVRTPAISSAPNQKSNYILPKLTTLPNYSFEETVFMVPLPPLVDEVLRGSKTFKHPFVRALTDAPTECWVTELSRTRIPWVKDHCVQGSVVFPAVAYVETLLQAGTLLFPGSPFELSEVAFKNMFILEDSKVYSYRVSVASSGIGRSWLDLEIHTREEPHTNEGPSQWRLHCCGRAIPLKSLTFTKSKAQAALGNMKKCTQVIDLPSFYTNLFKDGLQYGPLFNSPAQSITYATDKSYTCGHMKPPQGVLEDKDLPNFQGPHPAILDACLHPVVCLQDTSNGPALPVSFGRIVLLNPRAAESTTPSPLTAPTGEFYVCCESGPDASCKLLVVAHRESPDKEPVPVIVLEELRAKSLSSVEAKCPPYKWLAGKWDSIASTKVNMRHGTGCVCCLCRQNADALVPIPRKMFSEGLAALESVTSKMPRNFASLCFLVCLSRLGFYPPVGTKFTVQSVLTHCHVKAEHHRYFVSLLLFLTDMAPPYLECVTRPSNFLEMQFVVKKQWGDYVAEEKRFQQVNSQVTRDLPSLWPANVLVNRVREHFESLVQEGDSGASFVTMLFEVVEAYYSQIPMYTLLNNTIAEMVGNYISSVSKDCPIRILEVGAGTGGTTKSILPLLPQDRTTFYFTDLSKAFNKFAYALKEKYPCVEFAVFNAEKPCEDPSWTGFFDIVIAANVLHATTNLNNTLSNIRPLLKPSGIIFLNELEKEEVSALVFGLASGWWLATEEDRRQNFSPLLTGTQWSKYLVNAGFTNPKFFPLAKQDRFAFNLVMAQAPPPVSSTGTPSQLQPLSLIGRPLPLPPANTIVFWLGSEETLETTLRNKPVLEALGCEIVPVTVIASGHKMPAAQSGELFVQTSNPDSFNTLVDETLTMSQRNQPQRKIVFVHATALLSASQVSSDCEPDIDWIKTKVRRDLTSILFLVQAITRKNCKCKLLILTSGAHQWSDVEEHNVPYSAAMVGWGRTIMSEIGTELHTTLADVSSQQRQIELVSALEIMLDDQVDSSFEEYTMRFDKRAVYRIYEAPDVAAVSVPHKQVILSGPHSDSPIPYRAEYQPQRRKISTQERGIPEPIPMDNVVVKIVAAGLNFHDGMVVTGAMPPGSSDWSIGMEFSGVVQAVGEAVTNVRVGDKVVGFGDDLFGSHACVPALDVEKFPDTMSFEEAASIPSVFCTAYVGLIEMAHIQAGETVLIHSAAGGVGIAAIQLCKMRNCKIIVTVGSKSKEEFLKLYNVDHIFDSHTGDFEDQIKKLGGCDVVLNSLKSPLMEASIRCLRDFGRFVEIGKVDIFNGGKLPLSPFKRSIAFMSLHMDFLESSVLRKSMKEVMKLIEKGLIKPLPVTVSPMSHVDSALAAMGHGTHVGKLVASNARDRIVKVTPEGSVHTIKKTGAYVVTGGTGGVGFAMVEYLAHLGAGCVVAMSRSGGSSNLSQAISTVEAKTGCKIVICKCDIGQATTDVVTGVIKSAIGTLPVLGVVHCAMVLRDNGLASMTVDELEGAVSPKIFGAWNVLEALKRLSLKPEWWVSYSSAAALVGGQGQANYNAGNTFLDSMINFLRRKGIDSWSFNLGPVQDVGYVAGNKQAQENVALYGVRSLTGQEVLDTTFKCAMCLGTPRPPPSCSLGMMDVEWNTFFRNPFAKLSKRFTLLSDKDTASSKSVNLKALSSEGDAEALTPKVIQYLATATASVLHMPAGDVDVNTPLTQLGVDSLVTIELRQQIFSLLHVDVPVVALLKGPTLTELASYLISNLKGSAAGAATEKPKEATAASTAATSSAAVSALPSSASISTTSSNPYKVTALPRPAGNTTPVTCSLICFPFVQGTAAAFESWPERLPAYVEVLVTSCPNHVTVGPELPAALSAFFASRPEKPTRSIFYGHSTGTLSAYSVAWRFQRGDPECANIPPPCAIILSALRPPLPDALVHTPPLLIPSSVHPLIAQAHQMKEPPITLPMLVLQPTGDATNTAETLGKWQEYTTNPLFILRQVPGPHLNIVTHKEQPTTYISSFINRCVNLPLPTKTSTDHPMEDEVVSRKRAPADHPTPQDASDKKRRVDGRF